MRQLFHMTHIDNLGSLAEVEAILSRADVLRELLECDVDAFVNTVNCVGVSGAGVALAMRRAFPEYHAFYAEACSRGGVRPGRMLVFETHHLQRPRYIINFPTKRHWRARSLIGDIDAGLEALTHEVSARDIRSIAIPALGCGNGGLSWDDVRPRIEQAFAALPNVRLTLLPPGR